MAATLAYTRKFIILKKDFSTIVGINPKGHGKLEVKGIRGIFTVNIENAEKDNVYNVLFISNDKLNSILNLGKIFTDDIGRGKGEYIITQRELEAKNFPIDQIAGILIVRDKNVLLGGYIDKENGCIERYIGSMQRKPEPEPVSRLTAEGEEPNINPIYDTPAVEAVHEPIYDVPAVELTRDPIYDILAVESSHDPIYDTPATEPTYEPLYDVPAVEPELETSNDFPFEEVLEIIPEEPTIEESVVEDIIPEEIIGEIVEEIIPEEVLVEEIAPEQIQDEITLEGGLDFSIFDEDSMEPDYKTLDHIRKLNQKNQTTNYVLSILRFFPYIDPFKYKLKGYNWWVVELDKENEYRSFLPYFSYISGGNTKEPYASNITTCNQLMNKYQHYLFGLYNEGEKVKYFVYGIPGNFTQDEYPHKGANGFNVWHPGQNTEGYWLMFIDPMTGRPVNTPVPMIPID